ncbi:ACP S-malonyltransferase [Natribacillus halophilus]|uniref:Malonyl CoA-acyl carrier protein transacylase n=1 Tax=Natribacillus halophilus TaxID=549003 RepID=A0A1G8MIL2_9BACI|nr:ACP S-malonyltransferase [Natribacillus halophilus]SDI67724.1 [acyl-carrier-protein] S-malonyltransferase [Natribacillus halophilus]
MGKIAFLFPGQGSQALGMGSAAADDSEAAQAIMTQADETLGFDLTGIMENGPEDELKKTMNAQPALLTASTASLQLFSAVGIRPDYVAGHSLGEYSALVAAGAMAFRDAVMCVRKRGEFMEEAVPAGQGAMAAVMGMDRDDLEAVVTEVSAEGEAVQLANLNAPGQIAISGSAAGVKEAGERAKSRGARRVVPLNVSGPFHSQLMAPAREQLQDVLEPISFQNSDVPVVMNAYAESATDAETLKQALITQVTAPVLWEDTIRFLLADGVDTFIEIGSGQVLSGLVKKIQRRDVHVFSVESRADVEACAEAIKGGS